MLRLRYPGGDVRASVAHETGSRRIPPRQPENTGSVDRVRQAARPPKEQEVGAPPSIRPGRLHDGRERGQQLTSSGLGHGGERAK